MRLVKSNRVSAREARLASIVLLAAQGLTNQQIADRLGVGHIQVGRWRTRFVDCGVQAIIQDRPRRGRPRRVDAQEIVRLTNP